jgi:type VI secretion system protein ImpH
MASAERQSDTPVRESLFDEFYRFSFFRAVQLIERLFPQKKPLGQALIPREEPVRFAVKPGLAFPPSDISGLARGDEKEPVTMDVTFMGLIGPSGVLPHWYNELAIERTRQKDFSMTAFFDIFHHRLIALFYLAWRKYRLTENYLPGARDRISRCFLSLIGLGTAGLTERLGLPTEPLVYCSGLLSRSVPSAFAIESVIEYFSDVPAEVEQFIDRIVPIDPDDQTKLGAANGQLGIDAICGSFAWESQSKFRINLGPVGYARFIRFLPSGDLLQKVFSLAGYMVGVEYEFDVRAILRRDEVPPCTVGMVTPASPRLGWSTWVKSEDVMHEEHPYVTFQSSARAY